MTVVNLGNGWISGLSSDSKPTTYPAGTRFLETDTGLTFMYISSVWTQMHALFSNTFTNPLIKKIGSWNGENVSGERGLDGLFDGATAIAVGTGSTSLVRDSTGLRSRFTTGTTINSLSGIRFNASSRTERDLNPWTTWKIAIGSTGTIADTRIYIGLTSATAAPASTADYLANLSGVGFYYDTSVDGNWHIMQNSGGASSDKTTIANIATAAAGTFYFSLKAVNADSKFQYYYGTTHPTPSSTFTDINTAIPAASTLLGWMTYIECLVGSAAKTMDGYGCFAVQDG